MRKAIFLIRILIMAKEWWKKFFGKEYIETWAQAGMFRSTQREINFLEKVIPLRKKDEILDLCCGHGRHAIELARRGYKITGLDFSSYALGIARKEVKRRNLAINFVRGDARSFRFQRKFDVIINMFTAFGYGSREDDRKIIRNVGRSLKKRGKFFIDLQSLPWLWRNFKLVRRERVGKLLIVDKRTYDFLEGVVSSIHIVSDGTRKRINRTQTRSYTLAELKTLFAGEGLKVIKFFGSYRGQPFGFKFKRMLVVAKKI